MSKFNKSARETLVTNNEGSRAYDMKPVDKLITQVFSTFFNEKKFYGDNSESIKENIRECIKIDPEFVAKLAIYVRKEFYMRSISHVLAGELAHAPETKKYVKDVLKHITIRADDLTEILSYYLNEFGKPVPNSLKKGLSESIHKFDEYQLAKYNRKGAVTFKDIVMLTHPNDPRGLMKQILNDTLETPDTWETKVSKDGNNNESWEHLIKNKKLGYMALLRNLRNIIQSNVSDGVMEMVYSQLINRRLILQSKQLPFRFYSVYRELQEIPNATSKVFNALNKAINISVRNFEKIPGKTLIAVDTSFSMNHSVSNKSRIKCQHIARLLAACADGLCDESIVVTFDTELEKVALSGSDILNKAESIPVAGGGTNIRLPIEYLYENNIKVDRIILLSDNEINSWFDSKAPWKTGCMDSLNRYRKINPNVWFHGIDLQGYGTQQFKGDKVNIIAGWSEKVLNFINMVEQGTSTFKDEIKNYMI